ncbi:hypothetical protein Tco_0665021 [Tanacetum coccineum]
MAMCTQPTLSPGLSARVTEHPTLPLRKRYWGTFKPIVDIETEGDESEQAVPSEDTAADEPLGLGSVLVQQISDETPTPRLPICTTWEDPEDVATPALVEPVDEGFLAELGAQLELHKGILHDHTHCLDALPPTLFEGYSRDFTELFSREIHDLRMQHTADQSEMQELRDRVTALEQMIDHIEE